MIALKAFSVSMLLTMLVLLVGIYLIVILNYFGTGISSQIAFAVWLLLIISTITVPMYLILRKGTNEIIYEPDVEGSAYFSGS